MFMSSHESWGSRICSSNLLHSCSSRFWWYVSAPVSTMIVEDAEPDLDMLMGEGREAGMTNWPGVMFSSLMVVREDFRSVRVIWRRLVPSCVYDGRRALTMLPSASLQSLFLVAKTPNPSPPASSSFSLWRAICLSSRSRLRK